MKLDGINIRIHPMAPVMAALALWMGEGERLLAVSASLLLHELGHLLAARAAGVEVSELELMPLGGAIRLRGAWEMRPFQLCAVAAAGPAVNLLLACAATVAAKPLWINANLALLLFNLLPALPLDGGRVLCALLSQRMRLGRAVRVGVLCGYAATVALLAAFIAGLFRGRVNLTLLIAAAYLPLSGPREQALAEGAGISSLAARRREMEREGALPVRLLAVPVKATALEAAARLTPRHLHIICACDGDMNIVSTFTEGDLLRLALSSGDQPLSAQIKTSGNKPLSISKSMIFEERIASSLRSSQ